MRAVALIVYEHIITLGEEIELIWGRKFSPVSVLFAVNRYGALLYGALAVSAGYVVDHEVCSVCYIGEIGSHTIFSWQQRFA